MLYLLSYGRSSRAGSRTPRPSKRAAGLSGKSALFGASHTSVAVSMSFRQAGFPRHNHSMPYFVPFAVEIEEVLGLPRVEACLPPHVPVPKPGRCKGQKHKAVAKVVKKAKKAAKPSAPPPAAAAPAPAPASVESAKQDFADKIKKAGNPYVDKLMPIMGMGDMVTLGGPDKQINGVPTVSIADALKSYKAGGYHELNDSLRAGNVNTANVIFAVEALDALMPESKLTKDGHVYRGANGRNVFKDAFDGDLTGLEFEDAGYGSTSSWKEIADTFADYTADELDPKSRTIMSILAPKGTRAIGMALRLDNEDIEQEVLMDRGTRYRIVNDRGYNAAGNRLLDVEIIGQRDISGGER